MAGLGYRIGFRPHGLDMASSRSKGARQVYQLLKEGVPVWLMNFATAISKTRRLRGAYVNVSATFLRDLSFQSERNKLISHFLKIWHDVEVSLIVSALDLRHEA